MKYVVSTLTIAIILFSSCGSSKYLTDLNTFTENENGLYKGYLNFNELPNSLVLLSAPPPEGTTEFQADIEKVEEILMTDDTARLNKAHLDADLDFPVAISSFENIVGITISDSTTPYLYCLLRRVITDAATSTYLAKKHYKRPRPFMMNNKPNCTPDKTERLMEDGSYPSGHAAIGWSWALVLSEIFPEHTNRLLHRGKEFGESRIFCNVHWPSDVEAGRFMGSATVARLHGNPNFMADLKKAKKEVETLLMKN